MDLLILKVSCIGSVKTGMVYTLFIQFGVDMNFESKDPTLFQKSHESINPYLLARE